MIKSRRYVRKEGVYISGVWLLSQQVLRTGIADVSGIANITDIADNANIADDADITTDIADIVNIANIADRMLQILR